MTDAKLHHYVPQFLLRRFAAQDGFVRALNVRTGKPLCVSTRNTAAVKHYYDVLDLEGNLSPIGERALADIEGCSATLIDSIINGEVLDDEDYANLAAFVALAHLRTPLGRKWIKSMIENQYLSWVRARALFAPAFADMMQRYEKATGALPTTDEERETLRAYTLDALDDGRLTADLPTVNITKAMFELARDLGQSIYDMHWVIATAPEDCTFVLSDTPVAMHDPTPAAAGNALRSSPNAETTLPLDPMVCLVLNPEPANVIAHAVMTPEYLADVNLRSYAWADRYIYGNSQTAVTDVRIQAKDNPQRVAALRPRPPDFFMEVDWPESGERKKELRRYPIAHGRSYDRPRRSDTGR